MPVDVRVDAQAGNIRVDPIAASAPIFGSVLPARDGAGVPEFSNFAMFPPFVIRRRLGVHTTTMP
jgi:hypothetical protein